MFSRRANANRTRCPLGAKRLCVDTHYYETFSRDNVIWVDLRESALDGFTERGLGLADGRQYACDAVVFATGFGAITGALLAVDICGRKGVSLRKKWRNGTKNYFGVPVSGFPKLFIISGPGSPSVLYNMVASIEQNVDFVTDTIEHLRQHDYASIEAHPGEESAWTRGGEEIAALRAAGIAVEIVAGVTTALALGAEQIVGPVVAAFGGHGTLPV